jgi:hypothetical protein
MLCTVVKSDFFSVLFGEFTGISSIRFFVGTSDRDMTVSIFSANIFVIQGLSHKLGDTGNSGVCQTKLAKLVGILCLDHFKKKILTLFRSRLGHKSVCEMEFYPFDQLSVSVEWLAESYPTIGSSPVRGREYFK